MEHKMASPAKRPKWRYNFVAVTRRDIQTDLACKDAWLAFFIFPSFDIRWKYKTSWGLRRRML